MCDSPHELRRYELPTVIEVNETNASNATSQELLKSCDARPFVEKPLESEWKQAAAPSADLTATILNDKFIEESPFTLPGTFDYSKIMIYNLIIYNLMRPSAVHS